MGWSEQRRSVCSRRPLVLGSSSNEGCYSLGISIDTPLHTDTLKMKSGDTTEQTVRLPIIYVVGNCGLASKVTAEGMVRSPQPPTKAAGETGRYITPDVLTKESKPSSLSLRNNGHSLGIVLDRSSSPSFRAMLWAVVANSLNAPPLVATRRSIDRYQRSPSEQRREAA